VCQGGYFRTVVVAPRVVGDRVLPRIETPPEAADGINSYFSASVDYVPGSVRVFLNGVLLRRDLQDGWQEDPPRRVWMKEAPRSTDVVQLYYLAIS